MSPAEFMRAYETAINAHDLEGTLDLIAEEAIFWFSDKSSHCGKAAIRAALQKNFAAIKDEAYRIQGLTWLAASEEIAVCVYAFHWPGLIEGKPVSGEGRGTSIIGCAMGEWRLVHEHLSRGGWRPS